MNDKRDTANKAAKAPTGAKDPSKRKKSKATAKKKDNAEMQPVTDVDQEKGLPGEPASRTPSGDEGSDAEP